MTTLRLFLVGVISSGVFFFTAAELLSPLFLNILNDAVSMSMAKRSISKMLRVSIKSPSLKISCGIAGTI